jgi:hypothetical protein
MEVAVPFKRLYPSTNLFRLNPEEHSVMTRIIHYSDASPLKIDCFCHVSSEMSERSALRQTYSSSLHRNNRGMWKITRGPYITAVD